MADDLGGAVGGALGFIGQIDTNNTAKQIATSNQNWSQAMTEAQQRWERDMRQTAYQDTVSDLKASGLNPMLAYGQGATSTPSSPIAPVPTNRNYNSPISAGLDKFISSAVALAQKDKTEADTENTKADTDLKNAQTDEVSTRSQANQASVQVMSAQVNKINNEIAKIQQDTRTSASSAAELDQRVKNQQALIPQIQQTIAYLKGATNKSWYDAGLSNAQTNQIQQAIAANLPAVQAAMKEIETTLAKLQLPRAQQDASVNETWVGRLGALGRALQPIMSVLQQAKEHSR